MKKFKHGEELMAQRGPYHDWTKAFYVGVDPVEASHHIITGDDFLISVSDEFIKPTPKTRTVKIPKPVTRVEAAKWVIDSCFPYGYADIENIHPSDVEHAVKNGMAFATEEDAQMFVKAVRGV